jgi:hypothetical protein
MEKGEGEPIKGFVIIIISLITEKAYGFEYNT